MLINRLLNHFQIMNGICKFKFKHKVQQTKDVTVKNLNAWNYTAIATLSVRVVDKIVNVLVVKTTLNFLKFRRV